MKYISAALFIIAVCGGAAFSQSVQNEPPRFSYHIRGSVIDENSKPMALISVCFVPANRPIHGRIICTKTKSTGNYDFTVEDVPDKYIISASNKDGGLFLVGDVKKDFRGKNSEPMDFGAQDESREVNLQFDAPKND